MLEHVQLRRIPTTVCTMYCPNFQNPQQIEMSEPGLAALNNVIITQAIKVNVCTKTFSFDLDLVRYTCH
jgi:hypothetical protein